MGLQVATDLELMMADLINAERAKVGLDALHVEMHLNESAQQHSDWMGREGVLMHTGAGGSSSRERMEESGFDLSGSWSTRENVAYVSLTGGFDRSEVEDMHRNLMNSASHRANILSESVDYVGIGLGLGNVSQNGRDYDVAFVTQNFGRTESEVMVQDEVDGETVGVPYTDGEPSGEPMPVMEIPEVTNPNEPNNPDDPDDTEEDPQDEDSGGGGGCFVATAAYGHRMHPDVVSLRDFRDNHLIKSTLGRAFVKTYWKVGPLLAGKVSARGTSGRVTRTLLRPVVVLARRITQ